MNGYPISISALFEINFAGIFVLPLFGYSLLALVPRLGLDSLLDDELLLDVRVLVVVEPPLSLPRTATTSG